MAKGSLTDDQGKFLGDFQTDGAGLAMIYFTPNLATNYFIEWTAVDGNIRKNSLPAAKLGSKASLIRRMIKPSSNYRPISIHNL
ncbi:hypothetical protein KUH03_16635 [Sphingobacterium sp. E70]|uniref:hypothetical protein n=1 Tax=Sphingobacterium sp. E70 TaxID=2853439 RepID=UPI00211BD563|nr:hypothetical protein [Sphingobacterium sp. E70]ULT28077.1 hypothetical protein KUH03_16635 [Sphingobacterium sp. E70]